MKLRTLDFSFREMKDGQPVIHKKHSLIDIDDFRFILQMLLNQRIDFMARTPEEIKDTRSSLKRALMLARFQSDPNRREAIRDVLSLFDKRVGKEEEIDERSDTDKFPLLAAATQKFRLEGRKIAL